MKTNEMSQLEIIQIREKLGERIKEQEESAEQLRATLESKASEINALTSLVKDTEQKYEVKRRMSFRFIITNLS